MISNSASLSRPYRFLGAALVAALALVLSQTAFGQSAASTAAPHGTSATGTPAASEAPASTTAAHVPAALPAVAASKPQSSKGGSGAINQGFKMHGHWVIDVKNPDGTVVQHRDFENSLVSSAPQFLIGLMSGYFIPGDYEILLASLSGSAPCEGPQTGGCAIVRSLTTFPGANDCLIYYCGTGLTYTYNLANGGPYSMVLAGSITANQAGNIGEVVTRYNSCGNAPEVYGPPTTIETSSPASCVANTTTNLFGSLSSATITSVPVANGQIIQVTVTITFS
jgi:hypothetical protein